MRRGPPSGGDRTPAPGALENGRAVPRSVPVACRQRLVRGRPWVARWRGPHRGARRCRPGLVGPAGRAGEGGRPVGGRGGRRGRRAEPVGGTHRLGVPLGRVAGSWMFIANYWLWVRMRTTWAFLSGSTAVSRRCATCSMHMNIWRMPDDA